MTDNITRPNAEQVKFTSAKTGEHILDAYMEAAERGTKTLSELIDQLFDNDGNVDISVIQFRIDPSTQQFQVSISGGAYTDLAGFFRTKGNWATGTAYQRLDLVLQENAPYLCVQAHTSTSFAADADKWQPLIDTDALLPDEATTSTAGTIKLSTVTTTNAGVATDEAVTPKNLHDSIYNTDDTMVLVQSGKVTTGTSKIVYRQPRKITLTDIMAGLKTAQSSGDTPRTTTTSMCP
jgi:hypothetical protein